MHAKLASNGLNTKAISGMVSTGRQTGEGVQTNLWETVQQLCSRFRKTRDNITTNYFCVSSTVTPGDTTVGSLQQDKADLPLCCKPPRGFFRVWIQWQPYHGQLCLKERSCCVPEHHVSQQTVDENASKKKTEEHYGHDEKKLSLILLMSEFQD